MKILKKSIWHYYSKHSINGCQVRFIELFHLIQKPFLDNGIFGVLKRYKRPVVVDPGEAEHCDGITLEAGKAKLTALKTPILFLSAE